MYNEITKYENRLSIMNQNSTESDFQDIIIREPELVLVLNSDQIALLKYPRYMSLLKILYQKGPLILGDLTEEYAKLVKEDMAKSESSIFRYLTVLKENNLIQEAGQQVVEGKAHSKTLYSLIAKYLIDYEFKKDWAGSHGQMVFQELLKLLKILYPQKLIDEQALYQWQLRFQHSINADVKRLLTSKDPEILEILSIWTLYPFYDIISYLTWESFLIRESNAQENFLNCFTDSLGDEPTSLPSIINEDQEKEQATFRDVIRQFPDFFYGLSASDPRRHYLENPSYIPLFHVLRDGPMTIKELVEQYNQVAPVPKTRKTIYRYVKKLKKSKLVIEMGQRVIQGKRTTQKLYGPVCRNITDLGEYDPEWKSEQRLLLNNFLVILLNFLHPELPKINKECFHEFRAFVSHHGYIELIKELNLPKNRKAFELLHSHAYKEYYLIITSIFDYYFFLNIPNMHERLQKCFSP